MNDKIIENTDNSQKGNIPIIIPPDINNPPTFLPLKRIDGRYQLIEKLGTGSFGCVTLAKAAFDLQTIKKNYPIQNTLLNSSNYGIKNFVTKSQNLVAIKTMMTKLDTLHDYTRVREIKFILSIPSNNHLIQIFEIFIDNSNFQLHIVMETMEQNLYQLMRNRRRCYFSIPTLKSILAQILAGIKHIHKYNFFHRDIKPENILVSTSTSYFDKKWLTKGYYEHNYVVKLADFGLARSVDNKNPYTDYVSTRWYRSPEILLRNGYYSKPIDIWAFGCVAVEVANFKPLFPGSNEIDQIWKILQVLGTPINYNETSDFKPPGGKWDHAKILAENLELEFPHIEGISVTPFLSSSQLYDLIKVVERCLKWDPSDRATADEISMMSFFKGTLLQVSNEEEENKNDDEVTTNTDQALMFAGIKPMAQYKSQELIFHTNSINDSEIMESRIDDTDKRLTINEFLSQNDSSSHDDISKNLSLYQIDESSENIKQLTNDIETITKEDSQFFNDYGMETPLLDDQDDDEDEDDYEEDDEEDELYYNETSQNIGINSNFMTQNNGTDNINNNNMNPHYAFHSENLNEAHHNNNTSYDTSFNSIEQVTPRIFGANSVYPNNSTTNPSNITKCSIAKETEANSFFGNITF